MSKHTDQVLAIANDPEFNRFLAQREYQVTNSVLHLTHTVRAQSISHALHVAETTWKQDPRSAEFPDAMRDGLRGVWLEVI